MIYPSIDKILNTVESKYILVHVISKRSKQMIETGHYQMRECDYKQKKEIGRALEELNNNMITIVKR